jgi:hypothetical protein
MKGIVYQIEIGPYKQIGSTGDLQQRSYHHKYHLERGDHYNRFMQRVYNKYKVVEIVVLFEYETRKQAYEKEQDLLDKHYRQPYYLMEHPMAVGGSKPGIQHPGYGKKRPAHSNYLKENPDKCGLRYKRTEEHLKKASDRAKGWVSARDAKGNVVRVTKDEFNGRDDLKGHAANKSSPKRYRPVACIEDGINFVSIQEASKHYGISSGNIVENIKNRKRIGVKKLGREINFKYLEKTVVESLTL